MIEDRADEEGIHESVPLRSFLCLLQDEGARKQKHYLDC